MIEQAPGGPDICTCPDCDYEAEKERGVPCRSVTCPECGAKLVAKVEAEEMTIAQQAIETARAVVNDSAMLAKLAEARGKTPQRVANQMLDNLERELAEAVTKTVAGEKQPADGDVETPASEAALGEMYDSDEVTYIPMAVISFADLQAAEQAEQATARIRQMTYQFKELVSNIMFSPEVEDKAGALQTLTNEFAGLISDRIGDVEAADSGSDESDEPDESSAAAESLTENVGASAVADFTGDLAELGIDAVIETGRRAPVLVDFQVLEPGAGNKRDNHYYPRDVLERDANVFDGVDMFATDHKESERNERTKVGRVRACPTRFTESGAPVAQVIIYDPDQAEKARNRADAGELATLECSIFARGISEAGEVGGEPYKIVKQITEGKYLELVGKAGAGGHALSLAESETIGGNEMKDEKVAEDAPLEEDIEESEPEAEADESQEPVEETEVEVSESESLAEAEMEEALAETNLPAAFKAALGKVEYADADVLSAAIAEAITEVKALTGSGQPFGQGETRPVDRAATLAERDAAKDAVNRKWIKTRVKEVKSND